MAAVRSALMSLCRHRCGSSASSAAASTVARGLGVRQGVGAAATRTPALPSLRPAAARNLEERKTGRNLGVGTWHDGLWYLDRSKTKEEVYFALSASEDEAKGWRPFSTEGMEGACQNKPLLMKHKAQSVLRMLWQWSRDSVKNVTRDPTYVAASISFLTTFCFVRWTYRSSINASAISCTRTQPGNRTNVYSFLESPLAMAFIPGLGGIYLRSLRTAHGPRKTRARSPMPRAFALIPGLRSIYISSLHTAHGQRKAMTTVKTKNRL